MTVKEILSPCGSWQRCRSCKHDYKRDFRRPNCKRNGWSYEPAGTAWGPWWCFQHNVERINRISAQMQKVYDSMDPNQE